MERNVNLKNRVNYNNRTLRSEDAMPRGHHPYCKKVANEWLCELKNKKGNTLALGYGDTRKDSIDAAMVELKHVADHPLESVQGWSEEHPILSAIGILLAMFGVLAWGSKVSE